MPRLHNHHAALDCRRTPWDERVFGFACAEITQFQAQDKEAGLEVLSQFETWAQAQGVKFAYGRFEPTQLVKQVVHQGGFYFSEASYRIHYKKLQSSEAFDRLIRPGPVLEPATEADHDALRNILATDFEHGRIHEDPWVDPNHASQRYQNWLSDLISQNYEVFTYRLKNKIIGIHVQRSDQGKVDLILTGVKKSHALLGASLWADVIKLNRQRGLREAETLISASNIPIVNLYQKFNFQFESLLLGFHKRW